MLRIVLGFKTDRNNEDPKVLYCGHDGSAAQDVIDANVDKFHRVGRVDGVVVRKGKKTRELQATPIFAAAPAESPVGEEKDLSLPHAQESGALPGASDSTQGGEDGGGGDEALALDDDAPRLDPAPESSPKSRKRG